MPAIHQAQASLSGSISPCTTHKRRHHRLLAVFVAFSGVFMWGTQSLSIEEGQAFAEKI